MKTNLRTIAIVVAGIALAVAPLLGQGSVVASNAKTKSSIDKGDFKVGFSPATHSKDPKKRLDPEIASGFKEIADSLNSVIALPRDVYLNMDTCGEANAFYDPSTSEITICYELFEQYEKEFKTISKDPKEIDNMVEDTILQTLFHELGHCLIDVWQLPATGREEDAVDQLATVLMLDGSPEGADSAVNAALEFAIASSNESKDDMVFWDEHSFSKTRFYDMICLVYGSDTKKYAGLVGDDSLPRARAARCSTEYQRADKAWTKLLTPYILE